MTKKDPKKASPRRRCWGGGQGWEFGGVVEKVDRVPDWVSVVALLATQALAHTLVPWAYVASVEVESVGVRVISKNGKRKWLNLCTQLFRRHINLCQHFSANQTPKVGITRNNGGYL